MTVDRRLAGAKLATLLPGPGPGCGRSGWVIHGDRTTTAAKKGGDNLGFIERKKVKGDKVVAFCDRHRNVIAPFVTAPGNRNESPLLREVLPKVIRTFREVGSDLQGTIVSLDGVYDCRVNRKAIFNRGMVLNINPNPRGSKQPKRGRKPIFEPAIFKERFWTIERVFAGEGKFRRASAGCTTRSRPSPTR